MPNRSWLLILAASPAAGAFLAIAGHAQTGIQAHYADGQVWVRWTEEASPPETYAIYIGNGPFANVSQAQLAGRLFREEWLPLMWR